jgi:hypothetical protein
MIRRLRPQVHRRPGLRKPARRRSPAGRLARWSRAASLRA